MMMMTVMTAESIVGGSCTVDRAEVTAGGEVMSEISRFFARYASYMLGCGATCMRIDRNMQRMARALGVAIDMTILPSHALVTVTDPVTSQTSHHSCGVARIPVSYDMNTRLSKLSWHMAEHRLDLREACIAFDRIIAAPNVNPWIVMSLVVPANTAFCRLFGGDARAMLTVAFATMVGYSLKNILSSLRTDLRLTILACAFISATIGCAGYLFGFSGTPDVALGTSVLYLIPGIPYINSVSDMLDGHYLCAFSRFAHALVLTTCIALGMTGGILLMQLKVF